MVREVAMWRGMLQLLGAGMIVGACSLSTDGLDFQAAGTGGMTATPPAMRTGTTMPSGAGESNPAPGAVVRRVHDVDAKNLSVGVLFAQKLEAKSGSVASSGPPLPAAELSTQLGSEDIEAPDLVVDVLYAHDVKAHVVSVRELHVTDVKIGEKGDPQD
jgi:hypothetical protein